jgi:heptosyltransferase-2
VVERILIIKLGAKGDVVRTLPVLLALKEKYPNSNITWITNPPCIEILETTPYINKILPLPFSLKEFTEEFDLLLNFDIEKHATDLAKEIKAGKKYGFFMEEGYPMPFNPSAEYYLNTIFDDELKKTNPKTYQRMMFEIAELPYKMQHCPIFLSEEDMKYAEDFASSNNINKDKLIGIHVGSSPRWPSKAWHSETIKEFVKKAKEKGYEIILFGGPDESAKHENLIKELEQQGIKIFRNNPHNKDIEFFSLVNICNKMICSDSFSLHISLALKKSTIGLFFCTSPNEIESYGFLKKIISPQLYDFFPERQDEYNEELTKSISADEVLNALENNEKTKKVVNAIIKFNGKVLVIKRKDGIHSGKWAFPGGIVEKGEAFGEALRREIKEEVNLNLTEIIKKISGYSYARENGSSTEGECYLVNVEKGDIKINEEIEEFRFVSLDEFLQLEHIEGLDEEVLSVF